MILVADTSGIIAASDRNAAESVACRSVLQQAGTVIVSPLVLAEVDHLAKKRFGSAARTQIIDMILTQVERMRFLVPDVDRELLPLARSVQSRYAGLDLDLAVAVSVALAAKFRTEAVLTLDRRDFRTIRPLTQAKAFTLLPDDL
ncbi:PIN domain-containing protein [Nocardia puris]|uniref:PIN domain-containing protein n=1 Tax=Nocardia puris TaxID=208602 RepID=UPI0018960013|nr:PIN domain-containing protein [Nocardia puris]MBF6210760.1 PIN domain-containing protein [Nocardia puris]